MSLKMEVRRYKRYRSPNLELTEDSPVKKKQFKNYDRYDRTNILSDLLNISYLRQRIQANGDIKEVEKDPVLRKYLMAVQSDYGQMLDDTIRSFVSKKEKFTDVDIRGIKYHRPRELMENPNSFALLFSENYKHNNKNPRGQVFDYRLRGQNSRFNRLEKEKVLQYQEFRRSFKFQITRSFKFPRPEP